MAGELLRAAITGVAFLAVFALAEAWRAIRNPPVEWTRKLVHFGGGLIAAAFPWVFASHWTVLGLGAAFFLILWGTRRLGWLQSVHGVTRRSEGGLYFPVAVYALFLIGADRPVFYLISTLVLVVSDAVAAVLGSAYGRVGYAVERDRRTVEGSTVFFLSTFLIVHLPLLLMAGVDPRLSVLVGVQLALIVTLMEGISLRGNDNLIVPLATFFLLMKLTAQQPEFLAYQLAAQVLIMAVLAFLAWRLQFVTASGAMALMLFFYGAYSLGGEEWTVAPGVALMAFAALFALRVRRPGVPDPQYQVVATFYVAIVPAMLFVLNNAFETLIPSPGALGQGDPFYALYTGAAAAQFAIIVDLTERAARGGGSTWWVPAAAALGAWLLIAPASLLAGSAGLTVPGLLVAAAVTAVAMSAHELVRRSGRWPTHAPWVGRLQAVCVLAAVALLAPLALPR